MPAFGGNPRSSDSIDFERTATMKDMEELTLAEKVIARMICLAVFRGLLVKRNMLVQRRTCRVRKSRFRFRFLGRGLQHRLSPHRRLLAAVQECLRRAACLSALQYSRMTGVSMRRGATSHRKGDQQCSLRQLATESRLPKRLTERVLLLCFRMMRTTILVT